MFKKFVHAGNPFIIDVQKHGDQFHCLLSEEGGPEIKLSIDRADFRADGTLQIQAGKRTHTIRYLATNGRYFLHLAGQTITIEEAKHGESADATEGGYRSPMPGKVLSVKVRSGDVVAEGDVLVIVEAMKMENAIRAARDGIVQAVHCAEADLVTPDSVLVELGDPPE